MSGRLVFVLAALCIAASFLGGAAVHWYLRDTAGLQRAQHYQLLDKNGDVRAALQMFRDGPALAFYDEDGQARLVLRIDEGDPYLALHDVRGETKALFRAESNRTFLSLYDEYGRNRAAFLVGRDMPSMMLYGPDEQPLIQLGARPDRTYIDILDAGRLPRLTMRLESDVPFVGLYDQAQLLKVGLHGLSDQPFIEVKGRGPAGRLAIRGAWAGLTLSDEFGQAIVELEGDSQTPGLDIYEPDGTQRVHLGIEEGEPRLDLSPPEPVVESGSADADQPESP